MNQEPCFTLSPHLVRDNAWPRQRRELLAAQLAQHQREICFKLGRERGEALGLPEDAAWLEAHYRAWAESLTEAGGDVFLRWQALPDAWPEQERCRALAWALLDAARDFFGATDLFVCREHLRQAEHNALCRTQAEIFQDRAERFCTAISEEFQRTPLDFSDAQGRKPSLEGLSWDLILLFQEWRDSGAGDSLELEQRFVSLFCQHIIARYSAAPRFWELLLVRLERALCGELGDACVQHVLSPALEALLGAVPRYAFLRSYQETVRPAYTGMPLPADEILLWQMIGAGRGHGAFYQNLLHTCVVDVRVRQLTDPAQFTEDLKQRRVAGEEKLRTLWERAQIDWFSDACAWLEGQVLNARQVPALVQAASAQLEALSARLSEGAADAESDLRLRRMLGCMLEILCLTATLDENLQLGRTRLRRHLALLVTPDPNWPLWRKHGEIAAGLKRLELGEHPLWQQAAPLLNVLDPLLAALCRNPLQATDDLEIPACAVLPADILPTLLDLQHLYPRYLRRRRLVQSLLERLPADFDTHELDHDLQAWKNATEATLPGLSRCWDDARADLPLLAALARVLPETHALALQASDNVRAESPAYVAEVGDKGLQSCAEDNAFTLQRVAQVLLGGYLDPQEALQWWWETSVGGYLVHRAQEGLGANLRGLRSALAQRLEDDAAVHSLFRPMHQLYNEIVGGDVLLTRPVSGPGFVMLPLEGVRQRRLAAAPAPLPVFLDDFTACAERYQSGGTPQGPLCLDLGSDDLARPLQEQLQALLHIYLVQGDLEMALHSMLAGSDGAFRAHSTEELGIAWRQLLALLPEALAIARSGYWALVFEQALEALRQAGLGRYLETHAEELGERLEAYVGHLTEFTDADRHRHHLSELCRHLGRILCRQPPSLAALDSGRYLVAQAMPRLDYPAPVWHVLWQRLGALCLPELDSSERLALHVWLNQWDLQAQDLPAARSLAQGVFGSEEFVFAEDPEQEQAWRGVLSGLLAAALTPDAAPVPGAALAQRLVLSSPVFAEETAATWQSRYTALRSAFTGQLPEELREALEQQHLHISDLLQRLPVLEALESLPRIQRFIFALSRLPLNRRLWQVGCMIQAAERPRFELAGQERFLAHSVDWTCAPESALKAHAETYQAACFYRCEQNLANASAAAREELDIALRMTALSAFSAAPEAALRRWLFEMIPQLEAEDLDAAVRILDAWTAHLRRQDTLAGLAERIDAAWQAAGLGHLLAYHSAPLAEHAVQAGRLDLNEAQLATCVRDMGFVFHHLGLMLGGQDRGRTPAVWYWRHVACFLPPQVRDEVRALFPHLSEYLGSRLQAAQRPVLEKLQADLCEVFELPEWSHMAAYRPGTAPALQAAAPAGIRAFVSLSHQGPRWRDVFAHTQVDTALLDSLQDKPLWPRQLAEPPLYVANMVSAQLTAFIAALQSHGGDEEIAWQEVLPLFDEALQQVSAHNLNRAWQALAARLPELAGEAASVYWQGVFARAEEMLQQVALGRLLMREAEDCAEHLGAYFMEKVGDAGQIHKCQRDLDLFLQHMATALRTQAPTLAALNISRYLLEMVMPFVAYSTELWRLLWLRLERRLRDHADAVEGIALARWMAQLDLVVEALPHTRKLGHAVFHAGTACFNEDPMQEQDWQVAFSALLCAAFTPEEAPLPGRALGQRLLLSSPVFAAETSESWQTRQQQLNELSAAHLDKRWNVPLLVRHSQIIANLMKLHQVAEAQPGEGLVTFAGVLSGLPYAESLWRDLQWRRSLARPDEVPGPETLVVSQITGWPVASPDSLRRAADAYHAACAFRADFPVVWHKWRLGGLLGRIDSNVLHSTPAQQHMLELFLARLVLLHLPGNSEVVLKRHLFGLFAEFAEYLPEQREALLYHLQQAVVRAYGEGHPLSVHAAALSTWLPAVSTALILLRDSDTLAGKWLPGHTQCAGDVGFLLYRLGLHLSGLEPSPNLGEWYWRQIGVFLPAEGYVQIRPMFMELQKSLAKHLNPAHVKCLEPLLQEILHVVAAKTPVPNPSTAWKVSS